MLSLTLNSEDLECKLKAAASQLCWSEMPWEAWSFAEAAWWLSKNESLPVLWGQE